MSNFIRYQNGKGSLATQGILKKIFLGADDAELHEAGKCGPVKHNTIWIPDGVEITDTVSIEKVNGHLAACSEADGLVYFWVSGARGPRNKCHKQLLLPPRVELLAAGGEAAHQPDWHNKITSAIFRVPKGTKKVVIGDIFGNSSQAITFTCDATSGEWEVTVEPLGRFRALNPDWSGLQSKRNGDEPPLPLPALVE